MPTDKFTEIQLYAFWASYVDNLLKKGKRSVASVMKANKPEVVNNNVRFTLPNNLMSYQLERIKPGLVKYLKTNLNNYSIELEIVVNETVDKKFAYTPQEKYLKMKEKNIFIEKLKKTFDLDL